MENVGSLLRRLGLVLAVVATLLVAPGTTALASSPSSSGPSAPTPAPVAPEVTAKAAKGEVPVIAVTRVPGEQVVDAVAADLPEGSASPITAGSAKQLAVTVDAAGLDALASSPDVVQVVEDKLNRVTADVWANAIGLPATQVAGWDGTGRTIAVLDVGFQVDHPYLTTSKVTAEACFSHATVIGQVESLCPGGATEAHGSGAAHFCTGMAGCEHGTHVAGIAAGGPVTTPSSLTGVAPGAKVIAVKVFTKDTSSIDCGSIAATPCLVAFDSDIAAALAWLGTLRTANDPLAANLDAVNLSLGGGAYAGACDANAPTIAAPVSSLRSQGIATVVAAGNNGLNGSGASVPQMSSPACISSVVSVGATTGTGSLASYSNLTAGTSILAPGSSINSSKPGSTYGLLSGTSMATPVVAGSLAVLRQRSSSATVTELVDDLRSTADPISTAVGSMPEVQLDAALALLPATVPSAPRDLVITRGVGSLSVSWSAPGFTGTGFSGYTVATSPSGGSCSTTLTMCVLAGLANGTTYRVSVTANNTAGPSGERTGLGLPSDVPGAPTTPTALAGNRTAVVSWTAPAFDGGSPILSYRVTASPGGQTCVTTALSCPFSGLANQVSTTFAVTATNAVGEGAASGPSTAVVPTLPAGSPFGSVDMVSAGVGTVKVSGWAIDPDTASPIAVHVYVDNIGAAITAGGSRPDVDAAFGYGPNHGFSATLPASGGTHTVCIYAINVPTGSNVGLTCRVVSVPSGSPIGSFDSATPAPGTISVGGWAIDPDTASPIAVHVYIDNVGAAITAGGYRPDIAAYFAPYGGNHGFNAALPASAGPHTVCIYAINVGVGGHVLLGCRTVTVGGSPFGSFDSAQRNLDGTVTVGGWAIDPDTAASIQVHVYVGNTLLPLTASGARSDLAAAFPGYGANHGFYAVLPVNGTGLPICAYAINTAGAGGNVLLGCK